MRPFTRSSSSARSAWLRRAVAAWAVLIQCLIVAAPVADCRGPSNVAHIEDAGDHASHFTHDERTCGMCATIALQGIVSVADSFGVALVDDGYVPAPAPTQRVDDHSPLVTRSRAPPVRG
jgi:hypothetical protein